MIQHKAFKYRIYPTKNQEVFLSKTFGCVRFVWNQLVANFNSYSKDGPNRPMNEKILKDSPEYTWLNEVMSVALQQKRMDFDETKKQFFNEKRAVKLGRMKFKSKGNRDSFRIPGSTTAVKSFCNIEAGIIKLPKMLPMKIILDRKFDGLIKSFTVSKVANQYFISILVEENIGLLPMAGCEVGIDLGLKDLIITSSGHKFQRISSMLEKTNLALKKVQKKLARTDKKSNNRNKLKLRLQKLYLRISRIRDDYYHNISTWLVKNYDAIYLENLNVAGMVKNQKLARAIQEAAWSTLVGMIKYKSNWYGKTVHQIDRFYPSSKTCSCCGHKLEKLDLSVREWTCPACYTVHDRDLNAAINIRNQGQIDCYDKIIPDGIAGQVILPMRLEKFVTKIERSSTLVLVDIGTDETARSLA